MVPAICRKLKRYCARSASRIPRARAAEHGAVAMIRRLVDFALDNRWLVFGAAILLFAWGIISFRDLPVEAYPDVANNYVQIITQWPGRAAEEVEQQVTIPIEIRWPASLTWFTCGHPHSPGSPA